MNQKEFLELLEAYRFSPQKRERVFLVTYIRKEGEIVREIVSERESTTLKGTYLSKSGKGGREVEVYEEDENPKGEGDQVIVEVIDSPRTLVIFGAGHVGTALARIGALLAYNIILIDDRTEFLFGEKLSNIDITRVQIPFEKVAEEVQVDNNSAVVIVTRGHYYDEICLRQYITSAAGFIGMIGSRRRVLGIFNRLRDSGVSEEHIKKVYAPIGLKIGARTPEEIAIAILAQIIGVLNHEIKGN